jgi:hypothetical protein
MAFNGIILCNNLWKLITWFKRRQDTQPDIEISSSYLICFRKQSITLKKNVHVLQTYQGLFYICIYNTTRTSVCLLVYAYIDKATAIFSPCPNPLAPPTHSDYLPPYYKEIICGPDISTYWKRLYFSISSFIRYFSFHKVPFHNLVETICCFRFEPSKFSLFFL